MSQESGEVEYVEDEIEESDMEDIEVQTHLALPLYESVIYIPSTYSHFISRYRHI